MILVPISLGELLDKITILKIKLLKVSNSNKLENIQKEYTLLSTIMNKEGISEEHALFQELYKLNLEFWEYHDWQRERWLSNTNENMIDIELYKKNRDEHKLNDRRAEIKKNLNILYKSEIVEEKQFISYQI
jgi:hypothetical protein